MSACDAFNEFARANPTINYGPDWLRLRSACLTGPNPALFAPVQIKIEPPALGFLGVKSSHTYQVRAASPQAALATMVAEIKSGSPLGQTAVAAFTEFKEQTKPLTPFDKALAIFGQVAMAFGSAAAGAPGFFAVPEALENIHGTIGGDMSLDLGKLLGGVGAAVGGIDSSAFGGFTQSIGGLLNAGGQIASAFAPAPTYAMSPVYSPPVVSSGPPVVQTMAGAPVLSAAAGAIARITGPILFKIASKLGLKRIPSLTWAIAMIRRIGKFLTSPEAIAAAIGISVAELATLITAHGAKKRRHMNPANAKALRRAARRIKGFHRLCGHIDLLKNRGRRSGFARCGTCKKSPCRCH